MQYLSITMWNLDFDLDAAHATRSGQCIYFLQLNAPQTFQRSFQR